MDNLIEKVEEQDSWSGGVSQSIMKPLFGRRTMEVDVISLPKFQC
jgi:hypothetical protein